MVLGVSGDVPLVEVGLVQETVSNLLLGRELDELTQQRDAAVPLCLGNVVPGLAGVAWRSHHLRRLRLDALTNRLDHLAKQLARRFGARDVDDRYNRRFQGRGFQGSRDFKEAFVGCHGSCHLGENPVP